MKVQLNLCGLFAAFTLAIPTAAQAINVLHIGNADSADYSAFITSKYSGSTWTHKASGLTADETVGGNLDRIGTFGGVAGTKLRDYIQTFDLVIVGNGVTSTNFVFAATTTPTVAPGASAAWASLTKPVLFHASLAARDTGNRPGMFSGDNSLSVTYTNPSETVRVSNTALGDAIFAGVTDPTNLYDSALGTFAETINTTASFGGGEVISNIVGTNTVAPNPAVTTRGIVFWNAGVTNGAATVNTLSAKRAYMPLRNANNSSSFLTADGKIVLGNLIDQLLIAPPGILPPSALTATSGISQVSLSWAGSAGAVSYNVKRSTTSGGPYTLISTSGAVTGTNFTDTTGTIGTTYYYVVSAVNSLAIESANSNQSSGVPVLVLSPIGLVATTGINQINLSWSASATAVSYNVKRSTTTAGPYTTISAPGAVTGITYSDTSVTNNITYYYVVTAVNASANESFNSNEASSVAVPVIQPAIKILYVANANSTAYQTFATSGQFSNNTWAQKATALTGNDTIGGDLDRTANFTGINAGTGITVKDYMQSFDLIIVNLPTTSLNLVDGANGADWSALTKPVLFNIAVGARAASGRPGLFSQDNFITFTHGNPADTARASTSALANAILAGVTSETDLYSLSTSDTINGIALCGTGERITSLTDGTVSHYGIVFWEAGDLSGAGQTLDSNRAYMPLKGTIDDLTADGKLVLGNLINQLQLAQVTPANPYGSWAATNISAVNPLASPAFNTDAEGDGVSNGLEWILGGDPLVSDSGSILPVSSGSASNGLTLVFNRSADSIGGTTLSVQWDTNLSGLLNTIPIGTSDVGPSGTNPTVDIDAPAVGKITVNIPAANAVGGKIFGRLKAIQP